MQNNLLILKYQDLKAKDSEAYPCCGDDEVLLFAMAYCINSAIRSLPFFV